MTPHEVKGILAALVELDSRHRTADTTSAEAKEVMWTQMLADVDPEWCFNYIKREHSVTRAFRLEVHTIKGAWKNEVSYRERMARKLQPSGPDVRQTAERIAQIRAEAGLRPYSEPKPKRRMTESNGQMLKTKPQEEL